MAKRDTYRSIIEKDGDGFHGFVPLLSGLHTTGSTLEETKRNLEDAIKCHLEGLKKDGITPPLEQDSMEVIQTITL